MKEKSQYHVHTSGGLLSRQFIEKLRSKDCKEQYARPSSFSVQGEEPPKPVDLDKQITTAWKNLLARWHGVTLSLKKYDVSKARQKWILPFLEELGFKPRYLKKDTMVMKDDGEQKESFPFSHRGGDWTNAPIIHTVAPSQDLDERVSLGRGSKSPHDTLQIYLNHSKEEKWGIVTNGILLRLIGQYHHVYTKGYVEFDLEGIFEERLFSDFLALYRLAHPSRFVRDEKGLCPLEHFYKVSLAAGEKVGNKLRKNVKKAIEVLGNGFLTRELAEELSQDSEKAKEYYQEVLHVIYRVMFLMFAEQRGMLPSRDSLYASAYSMTKFRERAEKAKRKDRHKDLWQGLLTSFKLIKEGVEDPDSKMKIFGYNGSLFDDEKIQTLKELHCENTHILEAVGCLTYFEQDKAKQRISYVDLGVEEIGSIYESLLDFTPRVAEEDTVVEGVTYTKGKFFLDPRGAARKSTGSYYTNPQLVNELIKSALKPVVEDRLREAEDKEETLLSLKVCDPAMGSGAFLIAATNFLGKELAKLRTGTEYPSEKEERRARRDVLQHCIYGVDLNPMAVELAKVSLWIDACVEDMPLNFLDHHLKCGNSLIGTTPELLKKGIPTEAYSLKGADKETKELLRAIKTKNKEELGGTRGFRDLFWKEEPKKEFTPAEFEHLCEMSEDDASGVEQKKKEYQEFTQREAYLQEKHIVNAWTAAFFWPLEELENSREALTQGDLRNLEKYGIESFDSRKFEIIQTIADKNHYNFFHWHLEFPDVFLREEPGFDCVLGNPPWEIFEMKEKEFFEICAPEIANASTAAKRKKMIKNLQSTNPALYEYYQCELNKFERTTGFLRGSGRFGLTSGGRVNSYAVFAELARKIISKVGRAGIIIPTGIATDYTCRDFFGSVVNSQQLVSLYDFDNRERIFPTVDSRMKFSLFTMGSSGPSKADFAFFLHNTNELVDDEKRFELSREDLMLINPNTNTVPIFRSRQDAELTRNIYKKTSVLINEETSENLWKIRFKQGLFNMASDSHLFKTQQDLLNEGFELRSNIFQRKNEQFFPLYEGKMMWYYNSRFSSFEGIRTQDTRNTILTEYQNPNWEPMARYWVNETVFLKHKPQNNCLIGFRDITNVTNERTCVMSLLPNMPVGHTLPIILFEDYSHKKALYFVSLFSSMVFDYIVRQKVGGTHLSFHIVKQLPVLSPNSFTNPIDEIVMSLGIQLTYTSYSLQAFAQDILEEVGEETWQRWFRDASIHTSPPPEGQPAHPAPFVWDEERRAVLRAQLDAVYFHLYGLSREETDYILETFPIVKRKDEKKFGEYRTKRMILEFYDEYEEMMKEYKEKQGEKHAL